MISRIITLSALLCLAATEKALPKAMNVGNFLEKSEAGKIAAATKKISSKTRAKQSTVEIVVLKDQNVSMKNFGEHWFYYNHLPDTQKRHASSYLFALSIKHRSSVDGKKNANLQLYRNEDWIRLQHKTGKAPKSRKALKKKLEETYTSAGKCSGLIFGNRSGYDPIDEFLAVGAKQKKRPKLVLLDGTPPGTNVTSIDAVNKTIAGIKSSLEECDSDSNTVCECTYQLIKFEPHMSGTSSLNSEPVLFKFSTYKVRKMDLFVSSPNSPYMDNYYEINFE